ncbi:tyramine beta-hydroxylase-like [Biomphalaria glabrata]|uniref:Tyramine beta-hydroxylase-like n=1 Tax=Biomphalaria glabrata TaxID=6526 RepID=A0A9W2YEN4_BIOGL|nr:tyramine beta-hydroxylase-like [Biomphalaria glabrata]
MAIRIIVSVLLASCVTSYRIYQKRIPNGDSVPHPCKANNVWEGVGHFNDEGAGFRNVFGEDFEKEGKIWTEALCRKDSDGDGLTNGQELGDPECVWKENTLPSRHVNITHPGICDPWNSPNCLSKNTSHSRYYNQEEWMKEMCKQRDFICPGINETDVHTVNFTIAPGTRVPAKETIYMCQYFDFRKMAPQDEYHLIAVKPIQDNKYVIHHMKLFACTDDSVSVNQEPFLCGAHPSPSCTTELSVWSVGLTGDCYHAMTGITIGNRGFKTFAISVHWNNPDIRSDWIDSSGMMAYFTNKKRPHEAGTYSLGPWQFLLPPRQPSVSITSTCPSQCTRKIIKNYMNVTSAWNHMHLAGKQMSIKIVRNKTEVLYLTNEMTYNYDSPELMLYSENPFQILPGDEIITKCTYSTSKRNSATIAGQSTFDEMCTGFLIYYPKENVENLDCFTYGPDVNRCDMSTYQGCSNLFNYSNTEWLNSTQMYRDLVSNCRRYGPCFKECLDSILRLKNSNPCLNGEIFDYIKQHMWYSSVIGQELLSLFSSCAVEVYKALENTNTASTNTATAPTPNKDTAGNNLGTTTKPLVLTFYLVIAFVFSIFIHMSS